MNDYAALALRLQQGTYKVDSSTQEIGREHHYCGRVAIHLDLDFVRVVPGGLDGAFNSCADYKSAPHDRRSYEQMRTATYPYPTLQDSNPRIE